MLSNCKSCFRFTRYIAVHYPLDYSQAMHEANALTIRIFKYVSAVVALSGIFTFTKFLEARIVWMGDCGGSANCANGTVWSDTMNDTLTNSTIWKPQMTYTDLRIDPWYTQYYNWSRMLVIGVIPFVMLVYLNAQIFKDIKARSKRRFNTKPAASQTCTQNNTTAGGMRYREASTNPVIDKDDASTASKIKNKIWFRKKSPKNKLTTLKIIGDNVTVIDKSNTTVAEVTELTQIRSASNENGDMDIDATHTSSHLNNTPDKKEGDIIHTSKNGGEDIQNASEIIAIKDNAIVVENETAPMIESCVELTPTGKNKELSFV